MIARQLEKSQLTACEICVCIASDLNISHVKIHDHFLFICLFVKTHIKQSFGRMNGLFFVFFFLSCSGAVYTAGIRPREGSYFNLLTPAVSANV